MTQPIDPNKLYSRPEAAQALGCASQTLACWASRGGGPRMIRISRTGRGGRVKYRGADLIQWLEEHEYLSTQAAAK